MAWLEVTGPRLVLRWATAADVPALYALGRDAEVTRFFSWGPYTDPSEPAAYVAGLAARREAGEQMDLLIVHRDAGPIGVTGLSELSRRDRRCVVGTWLGRTWWGRGANAESKALVAALAFRVLGMERLTAYADVENGRSQRALERLGFAREGVLHGWHRHGERVRDVVLYRFARPEWEASALAEVVVTVRGEAPAVWRVEPSGSVGWRPGCRRGAD